MKDPVNQLRVLQELEQNLDAMPIEVRDRVYGLPAILSTTLSVHYTVTAVFPQSQRDLELVERHLRGYVLGTHPAYPRERRHLLRLFCEAWKKPMESSPPTDPWSLFEEMMFWTQYNSAHDGLSRKQMIWVQQLITVCIIYYGTLDGNHLSKSAYKDFVTKG